MAEGLQFRAIKVFDRGGGTPRSGSYCATIATSDSWSANGGAGGRDAVGAERMQALVARMGLTLFRAACAAMGPVGTDDAPGDRRADGGVWKAETPDRGYLDESRFRLAAN